MSSFFNTFILIIAISLGLAGYFVLRDGELPQISDQYWGSGSAPTSEDKSIRPFQINISEKVLTDLRTRLSLEVASQDERVADNLEGVGFEYGMNKKFLKKVVTHWLNQYDWKQREKMLNKYPSFKTKISGIDIHFQHVKPSTKGKRGNLPLLLIHVSLTTGYACIFHASHLDENFTNSIPLLNSRLGVASVIYGISEADSSTC